MCRRLRIIIQDNDDDHSVPIAAGPVKLSPAAPSLMAPSMLSNLSTSTFTGPSGPSFSSFRDQLINLLHIPIYLTNRAPADLRTSYQKYLAFLIASTTLDKMCAAKTWPGKKPSVTDLIECFIPKMFWHDYYKPSFTKLSSYPTMVSWLEGGDDVPSNVEAWGVEKSAYVFKDLIEFIGSGGVLKVDTVKNVGSKRKAGDEASEEKKGKVAGKKSSGKKVKKVEKKVEKKAVVESPPKPKKRRISS